MVTDTTNWNFQRAGKQIIRVVVPLVSFAMELLSDAGSHCDKRLRMSPVDVGFHDVTV